MSQKQINKENWEKHIKEKQSSIQLEKINDLKYHNLCQRQRVIIIIILLKMSYLKIFIQKEMLDKYYLEEKHEAFKNMTKIAHENKNLSEEKKKKEQVEIERNNDLNQLEIESQLNMPLLTEDPKQSQSHFKKTKVVI